MARRRRSWRGREALALALCAACFDASSLRHQPCDDDALCGRGVACVDGFCGGPPALEACSPVTEIEVSRMEPTVMLVIDRSGTMASDGRWAATVGFVEALGGELAETTNFGLVLFPRKNASDSQAPSACDMSGQVPRALPGPGSFAAVMGALLEVEPRGGSPTAAGVEIAALALDGPPPQIGRLEVEGWEYTRESEVLEQVRGEMTRAIVLITDGAPQCAEELLNNDDASLKFETYDPKVREIVADAALAGIPTYVVGVAIVDALSPVKADGQPDAVNPHDILGELATAGGTARATSPLFYTIDEAPALAAELRKLPRTALSCTIPADPEPTSPIDLEVEVAGSPVPWRSAPSCEVGGEAIDGYTFVDAAGRRSIELCGAPCADYQETGSLRITRRCEKASDGAP